MKHHLPIAFLIFLTIGCASATRPGNSPHPQKEEREPARPGIRQDIPPSTQQGTLPFSLDLKSELAKKDGNLFFSPASVYLALGMTAVGAENNTKSQMLSVLHLPELGENQLADFRNLMTALSENSDGCQLSLANRLWSEQSYSILEKFQETVRKNFLADMWPMNFRGAPEASRQEINAWVEEKTKDKIKDLIPSGAITSYTRLVLTNAVYFKGDWAAAFSKQNTQDLPFLTTKDQAANPQNAKKVPLMFREDVYSYYRGDGFQAVSLPYRGGQTQIEMLVFLPNEIDGLPALENRMTPELFQNAVRGMYPMNVKLWLPKFRMEKTFELSGTLEKMGMRDVFSMAADFSGMTGVRDLFFTLVIHKAYVDVNEEGTEAAAATAVVMYTGTASGRESQPPVIIFKADHPFLFAIRDKNTGAILFLGRVVSP